MAIDHCGISSSAASLEGVVQWYLAALKPLGYEKLADFLDGAVVGIGADKKADFWITSTKEEPNVKNHFAFTASDRKAVDAFHAAGVEIGGKCNGKPGVRPHYHPNYYAAFVFDPLGNNIEVVCHLHE